MTPATAVGVEEYRSLMARLASGVTVLTSLDNECRPVGLTCTSLASVSLKPPILLASLQSGSRTLTAMRTARTFAVNILHERAQAAAEMFAAPVLDRFASVRWEPSPNAGTPWLVDDALAVADCVLVDQRRVGDHVVVFGRVTDVAYGRGRPLLYGMRCYASWTGADDA